MSVLSFRSDRCHGQIRRLLGYLLEQLKKHLVRIDSLGLCLEIEDDPMAHGWQEHASYVFKTDIKSTVQQGACLCCECQRLRSTRAAAPAQLLLRDWQSKFSSRVRRKRQADNIILNVFCQNYGANQLLPAQDFLDFHYFFWSRVFATGSAVNDRR